MKVKTLHPNSDLQLVHGYGDGGFRVSQKRYEGDLFLHPRKVQPWVHVSLDSLNFAELKNYFGTDPAPLFLLGVGEPPTHQYFELATDLKANGISLEIMSTAAACRTWNVLMTEGRNACAGLIAL